MLTTRIYPPSMPLDTRKFNSLTEGKNTYREELLYLYFLNCEECLAVMERNMYADTGKLWHYALDEIKNVSYRIGADEISKTCTALEGSGMFSAEERRKAWLEIKNHIQRLRAFVRNTGY